MLSLLIQHKIWFLLKRTGARRFSGFLKATEDRRGYFLFESLSKLCREVYHLATQDEGAFNK